MIADGNHARADSYVSLAVIASAIVVALGLPIADPLIGLGITAVILKDHLGLLVDGARPRSGPLSTDTAITYFGTRFSASAGEIATV